MPGKQAVADLQFAAGDFLDEAGCVAQRPKGREAALQEALQLGKSGRSRRAAGEPQQGAKGRLGHRTLQVDAQPVDQHDLIAAQPTQAHLAVGGGVVSLADRRRIDQRVQGGRKAQVHGVAEHGQLDRIGSGTEQPVGQHATHERQHALDVAVAAAHIEIAIQIAEEELRGRPLPRRCQEIGKAATQPSGLPLLQRLQQWQLVAEFALRVTQPGVGFKQRAQTLLGG